MTGQWVEIDAEADLAALLGVETGAAVSPHDAMLAPDSAKYLRVETTMPSLPPGQVGYLVPRTRIYFNVSACRQLWGDAMVALSAYLVTQSAPAAAAATTFRKLYSSLKLLSPEEAALVHAIIECAGSNPYESPVSESDLHAALGDTDGVDDLLDALQRKGVISTRRGGRIQLTF